MKSLTINRPLKAAIILKYGTQFGYAAALGIAESIVSNVVRGKTALDDVEKKHWARVLGVKDFDRLFPGGAKANRLER